jgi:drug/metabolite transporter (DMT)-like permease
LQPWTAVRPADLVRLVTLAAIWGGSYALMRIVAPVLGGIGTAWIRILIAGALLSMYALSIGTSLEWKTWWKHYLLIGLMNSAIPFSLIAFAMQTLPANYGAIINTLSPLFGAIFAFFMLGEPIGTRKILGILLGFIGVAALVRLGPIPVTAEVLVGALACALATACYGFVSVYTKKHTAAAPMLGLAAGALLLPGILMTPLALPSMPNSIPSAEVILGALVLAVLCSAIAYLLYFRLIRDVGPTKAISVTFLVPIFGVFWGVIFLHEIVTPTTLLGGATILIGMALVLGIRMPRTALS